MSNKSVIASAAVAGFMFCIPAGYCQEAPEQADGTTTAATIVPPPDNITTATAMTANDVVTTSPAEAADLSPADSPGQAPDLAETLTTSSQATLPEAGPQPEQAAPSVTTTTEDSPTTATSAPETTSTVSANAAVTLPEGVTYEVLRPGSGEKAQTSSTLLIHYTLYLSNGEKVESSRDAIFPVPFQFTVGQGDAIRGMELGTAGMQVGEVRKLQVPAELGYGEAGQGENIPPNADLVFEVELVDVK